MRRSEQREHVFKLLFMTQFNSEEEMPEQISLYFEELAPLEEKDQEVIQTRYAHIMEHLAEIDAILNEYSRGWKTSRMNRVDLNVLRLSVYEMKFDEDIPVGVAINEAVELAKLFGGEDSGSFVNGVLGKIASERKDDAEGPLKPRRPSHQAKIIIRTHKEKELTDGKQKNQDKKEDTAEGGQSEKASEDIRKSSENYRGKRSDGAGNRDAKYRSRKSADSSRNSDAKYRGRKSDGSMDRGAKYRSGKDSNAKYRSGKNSGAKYHTGRSGGAGHRSDRAGKSES